MLHEFGHAKDFMQNYIRGQKGEPVLSMRKRLPEAIAAFNEDYAAGKCNSTIPTHIKGEARKGIDEAMDRFIHTRSRQRGLHPLERWQIDSRDYRQIKAESRADSFAAQFLLSHKEQYLKGQSDMRHEIDKKDFQLATGMLESKKFHYGQVDKEGKIDWHQGYLGTTPREGGNLVMIDVPDPVTGRAKLKLENLKNDKVERQMKQREDGYKNDIYITTPEGQFIFRSAEMTKNEGKLKENAASMNKRFKLKPGSNLQIAKVDIDDRDGSAIPDGSILGGKLKYEITDGHGIYFTNGANTTDIEEIYRKWKTYYIKTSSGSTYEVVPIDAYRKGNN